MLIWLTALAAPAGAIGYLLYANLLNPRATEQLTGTYDGFYWDAAQLQIAYARFENQLLLYQSGADDDYSAADAALPVAAIEAARDGRLDPAADRATRAAATADGRDPFAR